jgi:hypothetical protein
MRRGCFLLVMAGLLGLSVAAVIHQWTFVRRRFWEYPRVEKALAALAAQRSPLAREDGLTDFRGVFHAHSWLSHDSAGTAEEILAGAQRAGLDFVFLTDHHTDPADRKAIEQGMRGERGGVVFLPGVETSPGLIAWFLDHALLDGRAPLAEQIAAVNAAGGVAAVCHPDEPRPWEELPPFAAMEIYNLHADAKKSSLTMHKRLGEYFWSMDRYPMRVYHGLFHDPAEYLAIWDRLTARRRITGIAGNDAHQNNGLRVIVTARGTLALTDTSPKGKALVEWNNWLARRVASGRRAGDTVWRWDADLYERSFHFVNTHLLAPAKTETALRAALEAGHAYVAFDSLVTATGFNFSYAAGHRRSVMGDEVALEPGGMLRVESPLPAAIVLVRNGHQLAEAQGRFFRFPLREPGVYRAEVRLNVLGRATPWIYSNPIYVK